MRALFGIRLTAIVAAIAVMLAACGGGTPAATGGAATASATQAAKEPYLLTLGTDMSSPFTSACCSIPMANGFQAQIGYVNSQGGVNGHKIEIQVLDDRADVAAGLANYQQALNSKSLGFLIEGSSTVFTPIAPKAIADHFVESNVGGYQGGIGVFPYIFNILANLPMFVDILPAFAATQVKSVQGANFAYFTYQSALTETFQPAITKAFTDKGWKAVYNQLVPTTTADFAVAAGGIAAGAPDLVVVDLLEGQLPQFVTQLRARGVTAPIVNFSSNIADATKAKIADKNLYYVEATASPNDTTNPAVAAMQKIAKDSGFTTGLDNAFFTIGYVHAQVIAAALKKCGDTCTRESLNTALETTTVPGGGLMAGNPGYSPQSHVMTTKLMVVKLDPATSLPKPMAGFGF